MLYQISKRTWNRREGKLSWRGDGLALTQSQQLSAHGNSSILLKSEDNVHVFIPPLPMEQEWLLLIKRMHSCHEQACKVLCSHQPWQNQ